MFGRFIKSLIKKRGKPSVEQTKKPLDIKEDKKLSSATKQNTPINTPIKPNGEEWVAKKYLQAARNGELLVVEEYLEKNHDNLAALNALDEFGHSALSLAAQNNRIEVVRLLLSKPGISLNTKSYDHRIPSEEASHNGHGAVANMIIAEMHRRTSKRSA